MTNLPASLQSIATPPPIFPTAVVERLVSEQYGLQGELQQLVSERDQNFRLTTADDRKFVVKIANSAEPTLISDFQIQALLHLQKRACKVAVPRIIRTRSGAVSASVSAGNSEHSLRVVSYLDGHLLEETTADESLALSLGRSVAEIDCALSDFEHAGDKQILLWDMQRAGELRSLMSHIAEPDLQSIVRRCLDDFEQHAVPEFASLRNQVIHNDINPGNVLVTGQEPNAVAAVIDFGDMIRAPLIIDVAIAAAYLRAEGEDALAQLVAFVAGFNEVTPLELQERKLLYDLLRMRLATTITLLYWRKSARPEGDAYMQKSLQSEGGAARFLARINSLSREEFAGRINIACSGN